jgi:hypothetical protein
MKWVCILCDGWHGATRPGQTPFVRLSATFIPRKIIIISTNVSQALTDNMQVTKDPRSAAVRTSIWGFPFKIYTRRIFFSNTHSPVLILRACARPGGCEFCRSQHWIHRLCPYWDVPVGFLKEISSYIGKWSNNARAAISELVLLSGCLIAFLIARWCARLQMSPQVRPYYLLSITSRYWTDSSPKAGGKTDLGARCFSITNSEEIVACWTNGSRVVFWRGQTNSFLDDFHSVFVDCPVCLDHVLFVLYPSLTFWFRL